MLEDKLIVSPIVLDYLVSISDMIEQLNIETKDFAHMKYSQ